MATELTGLLVATLLYLGALFLVAEATERGRLPQRLVRHPLVFALSLGVYGTSWTLYGSVGFADRQGYNFLAIYLGPVLACLLVPVVWLPLLRLVKTLQLSSLADLVAFRYQSQAAGVLVTGFMVLGSLPYLALQLRAVVDAARYVVPDLSGDLLGLGFSALLVVFTVLFGTRHHRIREPRPGLVMAIAAESVVKVIALLTVGAAAYFGVLGGPGGMTSWLAEHPQALARLYSPTREAPWVTLLVLSGAAAFLLPRQFHMAFAERPDSRAFLHATWLFPALLLVMNVGIVPILWAGQTLAPNQNPDLYVLVVAGRIPGLTTLAFLGGVSAASAMVIVCSLALAGMMLNHLVLPFWRPSGDVHAHLTRARRALVGTMVMAGWAAYATLEPTGGLVELGLVSFVAVAQLLPAMFGVLFWRRATAQGVLTGLLAGVVLWIILLILPRFGVHGFLEWTMDQAARIDAAWRDRWVASTGLTLLVNGGLCALVSIMTRPRPEERDAAATCVRDVLSPAPISHFEDVATLEARVAELLGEEGAAAEVEQALAELELTRAERRPDALRLLTERLERNLSGLIGPMPARSLLRQAPDLDVARAALTGHLRLLEARLEDAELSGDAARVDMVRRYFRGVLDDLPVGVAAVGPGADVILWNQHLAQLTHVSPLEAAGHRLDTLPDPWGPTLAQALLTPNPEPQELILSVAGSVKTVRVGRAELSEDADEPRGSVLVVEDLTVRRAFEAQLAHRERLASIGQLAAGVAHEVGNPLTGILMVASNLRRERLDADVSERLGMLIDQANRIQDIVRNLVDFSRADGGAAETGREARDAVTVREVVNEAVALLELGRRTREVRCDVEIDAAICVRGDRQRLIQVFLNLLANACDASRAGQAVEVRASEGALGWVRVDVIDHGVGVTEAQRARLFDPFFTTKPVGEGTGLGLAVVFSIVRSHGGRVEVDDTPGGGCTMQVFLLAQPEDAS
ncbi:MAG: PAS domain-containing protein [Deltaproteobacteria bacterium]|nr:PAS domain-containing protein [Deltaproteobacteria bacterium]